jgi:nucleoid DNA-binding protein
MTKSDLIAQLAERFPQLVAKDADLSVKMILAAMEEALAQGDRIEIRGFGSFSLNYRPPRDRSKSQVRRQGRGPRKMGSALQGREGIAGTRRRRSGCGRLDLSAQERGE